MTETSILEHWLGEVWDAAGQNYYKWEAFFSVCCNRASRPIIYLAQIKISTDLDILKSTVIKIIQGIAMFMFSQYHTK